MWSLRVGGVRIQAMLSLANFQYKPGIINREALVFSNSMNDEYH